MFASRAGYWAGDVLRISGHGRASGISVANNTTTANVHDLVDGELNRITIYADRRTALDAVGLRDQPRPRCRIAG